MSGTELEDVDELATRAAAVKRASRVLARATTATKNRALTEMARALRAREKEILDANARDCERAAATAGTHADLSVLDRLRLTTMRLNAMAGAIETVAGLPDPIGEEFDVAVRPSGLVVKKRRVPLGVIGVVYEARPNVTSDIAALALKAGNGVLLRGGSEASETNRVLVETMARPIADAGLPSDAVQLLTSVDRALIERMLRLREYIDVVIPRGGAGLIAFTLQHATVPVIETGAGVCHTYVDRAANPEMAVRIVHNAKVRRPTICNALDTLLVHRHIASSWLPRIAEVWGKAGVEIHADPQAAGILRECGVPCRDAAADDWGREFLSLTAAIKVVDGLEEALEHIRHYGSGHSEAIVTDDPEMAACFLNEVDAAAVYVNASTQFTDGGEFGLGAEVGISTQKIHARGPMGLRELTTYKWVIEGTGQVRPA